MQVSIEITNKEKYNNSVVSVDTSELKGTNDYNGTKAFAATGNLEIELVSGERKEVDGEIGSSDYKDDYGFILKLEE